MNLNWALPGRASRRSSSLAPSQNNIGPNSGQRNFDQNRSTPPNSPRTWIGRTSRARDRDRAPIVHSEDIPHLGIFNGIERREDWFGSLRRKGQQLGLFKGQASKNHHSSLADMRNGTSASDSSASGGQDNKQQQQVQPKNGAVHMNGINGAGTKIQMIGSPGHLNQTNYKEIRVLQGMQRQQQQVQQHMQQNQQQRPAQQRPIEQLNHNGFNHCPPNPIQNGFIDDHRLVQPIHQYHINPYQPNQKTPCTCPLPRKNIRIVRFAEQKEAGSCLNNGNAGPAPPQWQTPEDLTKSDQRSAFFNAPTAKTDGEDLQKDAEKNSYRPASPYYKPPSGVGNVRFADDEDPDQPDHPQVVSAPPAQQATPHIQISSPPPAPLQLSASYSGPAGGANAQEPVSYSARPSPATSGVYNKNMGLVFLQFGDETKRAILPDRLQTLEDIQQLFLKAYPTSMNAQYMLQDSVRIYIQDPSKLDFFYELDDLREVKDRTVLKLREQTTHAGLQSPTPLQQPPALLQATASSLQSSTYDTPGEALSHTGLSDHKVDDEVNYFSESELDRDEYGLRKSTSGSYLGSRGRPAPPPYYPRPQSALGPHTQAQAGRALGPPKPMRQFGGPGVGLGHIRDPRTIAAPPRMRSPFQTNSESDASFDAERSASVSRSGSVTPVVDEEARARMQSMEKQLAGLSSLVHSALSSKGGSESVFKDLDMLRREILGPPGAHSLDIETASDSGSMSRFSDFYYPSSAGSDGGGEIVQQIKTAKKKVVELKTDVQNLRRFAQINAQSSRDILKDAFERVTALLNNANINLNGEAHQRSSLLGNDPENAERKLINDEQEKHKIELRQVEGGLSEFECEIESLRQKVVSGDRRLRMHEVEHFTNLLTDIGRAAAGLKTGFPTLQHRLKNVMGAEMEKVVREEKFLKEEPERLDNALRRCKKLTNTMVTMKKLAMVQDPQGAMYGAARSQGYTGANGAPPPVPPPPEGYQSPTEEMMQSRIPEGAPRPKGNVLDSLLEELQTVGRGGPADKKVGFGEKARLNSGQSQAQDDRKTPTNEDPESDRYGTPEEGRPDALKKPTPNGGLPIGDGGYSTGNIPPPPPAPTVPPSPADYTPARRNLTAQYQTSNISSAELRVEQIDRSRSTTPSSVTSEPIYSTRTSNGGVPGKGVYVPPPPPPRSSSRSMQYLNGNNSNGNNSEMNIAELKHQLGQSTLPRARIQTNALGEELTSLHQPMDRFTKSASSSESVNSQDGAWNGPGGPGGPGKPPPPPPPRNRQELLEQRHMELLNKQKHLQNQYEHQQPNGQYSMRN